MIEDQKRELTLEEHFEQEHENIKTFGDDIIHMSVDRFNHLPNHVYLTIMIDMLLRLAAVFCKALMKMGLGNVKDFVDMWEMLLKNRVNDKEKKG